jgi:D-alanine-D-alanine ligase-like ATP-grasp enzyme
MTIAGATPPVSRGAGGAGDAPAGREPAARRTRGRTARAHARAARELATLLLQGRSATARRTARRRDEFHRQLWLDAAAALELPTRRVGTDLEIAIGARTVVMGRSTCSLESDSALERAGDKALVHRLLGERGVPVAPHRVFTLDTLAEAEAFLAAAPDACVVKPAQDTSGGRGVTTGVRDRDALLRAAATAAAAGSRAGRRTRGGALPVRLLAKLGDLRHVPLLIEHQIAGDNYRLLYLDGELIDAVCRPVPYVVGDGRTPIRELIDRANSVRTAAAGERGELVVHRDADLVNTLAGQSLTLASVPADGVAVRLKTTVNEGSVADHQPARAILCAEIVEQGAQAAAAVRARLAGVDVVATDPGLPLATSGGCVLEVNTTPGLAFHHHGRPGAVDVARVVLERLVEG